MKKHNPLRVISVVAARPNFMKIAPLIRAIDCNNQTSDRQIDHLLVHTGQHYDDAMSRAFFEHLGIPEADIHLGIGSGSHAEQVGWTMIEFEKVVRRKKPDWVIVVGDVNATCACSITAKKEHVQCAHIEAGLRSLDMNMPEEINRLVTDRLSDLLFTPDKFSNENLVREGVPEHKIKFVGNIMVDTLEAQRAKAELLDPYIIVRSALLDNQANLTLEQEKALKDNLIGLMTIHRPSNVDELNTLNGIIDFFIDEVVKDMPMIWPVHPRTIKQLQCFKLWEKVLACENFLLVRPLGYHELLRLNMSARIMFTDSGGLQEECCVLGTPCLTLRWNTERPVTLRTNGGASVLVGNKVETIRAEYKKTMGFERRPLRPELWDGKSADRIVKALLEASK